MHEFLTNQALLVGYGTAFASLAMLLPLIPDKIRQTLGYTSLVIFASVLVSFFEPGIGQAVLFLLNSGVKALWNLTE